MFLLHPQNAEFLQKKSPRPVFPQSRIWELVLLGVLFFTVLIAFLVLGLPAWKTWLDLRNNSALASAAVTGVRFEDRDVDYYTVRYAFAVNEQVYEREQKVDLDYFEFILANDRDLRVRYVKSDPSESRLEDVPPWGDFRVAGTVAAVILLVLWGGVLVFQLERRDQNAQLVEKGKLVKGEVVECVGHKPGRDSGLRQLITVFFSLHLYLLRRHRQGQYTVHLRYKFISPSSGTEIIKREKHIRNDLDPRSLPPPGTAVAVIFRTDKHFRVL
jgi:hypothetical protein